VKHAVYYNIIITYITVIHVDDGNTLCRYGHVYVFTRMHQVRLLGKKLINPCTLYSTHIQPSCSDLSTFVCLTSPAHLW